MEYDFNSYIVSFKQNPNYKYLTFGKPNGIIVIDGGKPALTYQLVISADSYTISEPLDIEEAVKQLQAAKEIKFPWMAKRKHDDAFGKARDKRKFQERKPITRTWIAQWYKDNPMSDWERAFYDAGNTEAIATEKPLTIEWLLTWLTQNPEPSAV